MIDLKGVPISFGYASGVAVIYDLEIEKRLELPQYSVTQSQAVSECDRLDDALQKSVVDLKALENKISNEPCLVGANGLMSAHMLMAEDIAKLVRQYIGSEFVNVEQALSEVIARLAAQFSKMQNQYFRQREQDVRDVGQRLMRHLGGIETSIGRVLPPDTIIVASELLPSEAVQLVKAGIAGIVSEYGGELSHTAILARSLGIPAVSGIPHVTSLIIPGTRLLVDGESGRVIQSNPVETEGLLAKKRKYEQHIRKLGVDEKLPCMTRDGLFVSLFSNVCLPAELASVAEHNLAGIGLFRTEFLFAEAQERPDLETQKCVYSGIADRLGNLPFVIRTFDLGGDKTPPFLQSSNALAPSSLHLRGLRFSLAEMELLDVQLRAILHIAQSSDVRILFPMVIGSDDLARAIEVVDKAVADLGLLRRPPLGAMIETPAALYALDEIFELIDFAAVGTNDLTQFMLAADRTLADSADACTAMHPAVLRAIKQVVETASKHGCPLCVCGEEAGHVDFACLLVGLGVRELSLTPSCAAGVRNAIRKIDSHDAGRIADLALRCRTPKHVRELCRELTILI